MGYINVNEIQLLNSVREGKLADYISKYEFALITAFRSCKDCLDKGLGAYLLKENKARNKKLEAKLLLKRYGIIKVNSIFVENYNSEFEISLEKEAFFIINLLEKDKFKETIIEFGQEFEQDFILYIPKTGIQNDGSCEVILVSTNNCPNGYPGTGTIGVEKKYSGIKISSIDEFMLEVRNKPFHLAEEINFRVIFMFHGSHMSGLGISYAANTDWQNLITD